jgi:hypothetical protein
VVGAAAGRASTPAVPAAALQPDVPSPGSLVDVDSAMQDAPEAREPAKSERRSQPPRQASRVGGGALHSRIAKLVRLVGADLAAKCRNKKNELAICCACGAGPAEVLSSAFVSFSHHSSILPSRCAFSQRRVASAGAVRERMGAPRAQSTVV